VIEINDSEWHCVTLHIIKEVWVKINLKVHYVVEYKEWTPESRKMETETGESQGGNERTTARGQKCLQNADCSRQEARLNRSPTVDKRVCLMARVGLLTKISARVSMECQEFQRDAIDYRKCRAKLRRQWNVSACSQFESAGALRDLRTMKSKWWAVSDWCPRSTCTRQAQTLRQDLECKYKFVRLVFNA